MIPRESGYYSGFYFLPIDDYFKNPSIFADTFPIEEEEKRSSFCDKNIVRLPARKEYRNE